VLSCHLINQRANYADSVALILSVTSLEGVVL
jgi:hypothetical protein